MRIAIKLALVCGCALTAQAREEFRREFSRTVTLAAGHGFRIENSFGNVTIHTQPKGEAAIRATIQCSAATASEARRCADRIQISIDEGGGSLAVRTEFPSLNERSNTGFRVDYDLDIPEAAPLEVRNRFGAVSLIGPHSASTIVNGNGNVTLSMGHGRQQIENSFGNVDVRGNEGEVIIRNTNGGVTAEDVSGTLDIADRFGKIHVTNAGRSLTIHSNNGEIEAVRVAGVATISNSFGPVVISEAKSDVNVHNRNGGITANGVVGAADFETSFGHVQFARIGKSLTVHAQNTSVAGQEVGGNRHGGDQLRDRGPPRHQGRRAHHGRQQPHQVGRRGGRDLRQDLVCRSAPGFRRGTGDRGEQQRLGDHRCPPRQARPGMPAHYGAYQFQPHPRGGAGRWTWLPGQRQHLFWRHPYRA